MAVPTKPDPALGIKNPPTSGSTKPGMEGIAGAPPTAEGSPGFNPTPFATPGDVDVTGHQQEQEYEGMGPSGIAPAAPVTAPDADLGEWADTPEFVSELGKKSELGEDLNKAPSFIPELPDDKPTATEWKVTSEQTVAGQFASIMDSDNPAFKVVQEQVRRAAAANGQANSAMATRAATMAMAEVGFQMAAADAATFARSAEFNATMQNQFGLAEQQFMHNALLNEQNFKHGVMMLREQQHALMEQISAELKANVHMAGTAAHLDMQKEAQRQNHVLQQMDRTHAMNRELMDEQQKFEWNRAEQSQRMELERMGAGATIDERMAGVNAQNQAALQDRAHRNNLDSMQAQFEYNWQTNNQQQDQALERMDRETSNELYRAEAQAGWQMQLQYMSEMGQNNRMLLSAMGDIGSNPNITAAQASAAMADVIRQYNAVNAQLQSVYMLPAGGSAATGYLNFSNHGTQPTGGSNPDIPFYGGQPASPAPSYGNPSGPKAPGPVNATPHPSNPSPAPVKKPPVNAPVKPLAPPAPAPAPAPVSGGGGGKPPWRDLGNVQQQVR